MTDNYFTEQELPQPDVQLQTQMKRVWNDIHALVEKLHYLDEQNLYLRLKLSEFEKHGEEDTRLVDEFRLKCEQLESYYNASCMTIEQLESQIRLQSEEIHKLENIGFDSRILDEEVGRLREEIDLLRSQIKLFENIKSENEILIRNLESIDQNRIEENERFENQRSELKSKIEALEEESRNFEYARQELVRKNVSLKIHGDENLVQKAYISELESRLLEFNKLRYDYALLENKNQDLLKSNEYLKQEIININLDYEEKHKNSQIQIENLNLELESELKNIERLKIDSAYMQQSLNNELAEKEELELSLKNLNLQMITLKKTIEEYSEKINITTETLKNIEIELNNFKEDLNHKDKLLIDSNNNLKEISKAKNKLETEYSSLYKDNLRMKASLEEATNTILKLDKDRIKLENNIFELMREKTDHIFISKDKHKRIIDIIEGQVLNIDKLLV